MSRGREYGKHCENCRHYMHTMGEYPCCECYGKSKWEAER